MYLLNPWPHLRSEQWQRNLHSTMYLLNPGDDHIKPLTFYYLHSTMYLLNPSPCALCIIHISSFTFHYVSIKSHMSMHSSYDHSLFTFHYVSIKSWAYLNALGGFSDLHSTMYLLNPSLCVFDSPPLYIYIPLCIY